jgi:putative transposase
MVCGGMPRKARIDAPGALHHIILRGIERRPIFNDDQDYRNYLDRLGGVITETSTHCYAWVLMPNHVHLLLKTGLVPLTTVMRRVLTGYAQQFNRRHKRHGHLFQNRYKSFLCEEDPYLLELVRYIHLNPLRAGLVKDLKVLAGWTRSGHSVLMGRVKRDWQDTDYVLSLFGRGVSSARRSYASFVAEGKGHGRRPELVGGGLLRSIGGWSTLAVNRSKGLRLMSDERILGSSEFVEDVLKRADEEYDRRTLARREGLDLDGLVNRISDYFGIDKEALKSSSKQREVCRARRLLCYFAVSRLMISCADIARKLNISPSSVSKSVMRGRSDSLLEEIERDVFYIRSVKR